MLAPVTVRATATLTQVAHPTAVDGQIAELQAKLLDEHDARLEGRFYFVAAIGLLIDIITFISAGVTAGLAILMVYLAFLAIYSKRCGVEGVQEALIWASKLIPIGNRRDEKTDEDAD